MMGLLSYWEKCTLGQIGHTSSRQGDILYERSRVKTLWKSHPSEKPTFWICHFNALRKILADRGQHNVFLAAIRQAQPGDMGV